MAENLRGDTPKAIALAKTRASMANDAYNPVPWFRSNGWSPRSRAIRADTSQNIFEKTGLGSVSRYTFFDFVRSMEMLKITNV